MSKLPDFEGLAMFAKVPKERTYAAAALNWGLGGDRVARDVATRRSARRSFVQPLFTPARADRFRANRLYADAGDIEHAALETARRPRGLVKVAGPMSLGMRCAGFDVQ